MNRRVMLFIVHSAIFAIGNFGIADVLLNFYFVSLGYDVETIGLFQSMPRLGGLLTGLPVAWVANRLGARKLIIYSTVILAATYLMLVLFPGLGMLALNRFLAGLFFGAIQIATAPLMMTLTDREHQTHQFAYQNVASMGGMAMGSFIGGYLPSILAGLAMMVLPGALLTGGLDLPPAQTPFAYAGGLLFAGLLVLISVLPLLRLDNPTVYIKREEGKGRAKGVWRSLSLIALPYLFFGFTGGLTFPFYNLFFRTSLNLPDEAVGIILTLGWLAMAVIPLLNPWMQRRFGGVRALTVSMTLAAAAFAVLSLSDLLILSVAAFAVGVAFRNIMGTLFQPLVLDILPGNQHNMVSSINFFFWNIGWFAATAFSGRLQTLIGYDGIMMIVAVGVFFNAISIPLILRFMYRREMIG
jgi:MFS family permease